MDSAFRCFRAPGAVACAVLALSLAACSGGSDNKAAAKAPAGTTLDITAVEPTFVAAAGTPGTLAETDRDAIVDTTRRYVIAGTIDPLHGKPVGNLAKIFTPAAIAALAGPDRAAVLDEGLPKSTGQVKATAEPLMLVALSDPTGAIGLVGVKLALDVSTTASGGPVNVKRSGELMFEKDADAWRITSYKLTADRSGAGIHIPTTSSTEKAP